MRKTLEKTILYLLIALILISSVYAALTDGLVSYYTLDNAQNLTGAMNDSLGLKALSLDNVQDGVTGFHNQAVQYVNNDQSMLRNVSLQGANFTMCMWLYQTENPATTDNWLFSAGSTSANDLEMYHSGQLLRLKLNIASTGYTCTANSGPSQNTWAFICGTVGVNTGLTVYINGTNASGVGEQCGDKHLPPSSNNLLIGDLDRYPDTYGFTGKMDEIMFWNRELTNAEIEDLYNSGTGKFFPFPPAITPTASFKNPLANPYKNNTLGQNITAQCTYQGEPLIYMDTTNPPTTLIASAVGTGNNYTTWIVNSSVVTTDGTYYYMANCSNSSSIASAVQTYTFDTSAPSITLNANNFFKSTNQSNSPQYNVSQAQLLNITFADDVDLFAFQINISSKGSDVYSIVNQSLSGTAYTFVKSLNTSAWPKNRVYSIDIWASDSHTSNTIPNYAVETKESQLKFNTDKKNAITINSVDKSTPLATYKTDRYSFDFNFLDEKKSRTFDIYSELPIIYRENSRYAGHLVMGTAKGGNWVDFESIGINGKPIVTKINDFHYQVTINTLAPSDKISFQSIGGLNTRNTQYLWYYGDYTLESLSGTSSAPFTIGLNFTKNMSFISNINANFSYNGTDYTANITKTNSTNHIAFIVNMPAFTINADTKSNFNFNVTIIQTDGSLEKKSINGSHTIYNFLLDNCSIANMQSASFSTFLEDYPTISFNGTIEVTGTYTTTGNPEIKSIYYQESDKPNYYLCVYPNSSIFYTDLYIKYIAPSGFTHRYYLVNASLTNTSQSFYLYNWNITTQTSDMRITIRNAEDYSYYENIIAKLQRFYVSENTWRTVQMDESGDYGLVFFNIKEENIDYRLVYSDRMNNILLTTTSMKFSCTSGICELTQKLTPYSTTTVAASIGHSISFNNNTRIINFTWSTTESSTARAIVTRETTTGTTTLCDSSQTGVAGSIYCNTTGYTGVFAATLQKDGVLKATKFIDAPDTQLFNFLDNLEGGIWSFAIMVTIMCFGLFSPAGVIIATIFGLVVIYFLGLLSAISITFIIIAAIIGIAIAIKVKT